MEGHVQNRSVWWFSWLNLQFVACWLRSAVFPSQWKRIGILLPNTFQSWLERRLQLFFLYLQEASLTLFFDQLWTGLRLKRRLVWSSNSCTIASSVPGTVSGPGTAITPSKIGHTKIHPCSFKRETRSRVAASSLWNNRNAMVDVSGRWRSARTISSKTCGCDRQRVSRTSLDSAANPAGPATGGIACRHSYRNRKTLSLQIYALSCCLTLNVTPWLRKSFPFFWLVDQNVLW